MTRGAGSSVKYMLLVATDAAAWNALTETERHEVFAGHGEFVETVSGNGEWVGGETLTDPSHSAVVRIRGEARQVTDGPFAETDEFVAGYYIVDVEDRERALELAAMIPHARFGAVEVRPLMSRSGTEM